MVKILIFNYFWGAKNAINQIFLSITSPIYWWCLLDKKVTLADRQHAYSQNWGEIGQNPDFCDFLAQKAH